ncbi:MAG TPA: hypothetical protein VJT67_03975 [Longimicrobiaceae bacterium]|nr:hypothetical protein [Longimicrobiaceae bacterium]
MHTTTADPLATEALELPQNLGLTIQPRAPDDDAGDAEPAMNPAPEFFDVLREQFSAVGLALRREGLVTGLCMLFFSAVLLLRQFGGGPTQLPFTFKEGVATAMMALLIPMAVWKGEEPARRGYHQSMPVDHGDHAIARGAAGLGWTLAAVGAFFGWMGLLTLATGGSVEAGEPWQWLAPVIGATVTYLLGSALTLVSARPWRWLGGGAVAYLFLGMFRRSDGLTPLVDLVDAVFTGRFGLRTLLTGLVRNPADTYPWMVPDLGAWITTVWIWVVMAVAAFLVAAHRQPEN